MDFSATEEQQALRELTAQIVNDRCTTEALRDAADSEHGTDLELWRLLGDRGLIDPELGWLETCVVLAELARGAAPVPAFAVMGLALGALPGGHRLRDEVVRGERVVTAAIHEPVGDPWRPTTTVDRNRVTGEKTCVINGPLATHFLVTTDDGLHLICADTLGVTVLPQTTSSDATDAHLILDGVVAERVGGANSVEELLWRGLSAASIMTAAACEAALGLLASYAVEREQFDKPIAAFQAVSQRAANAYIDTEAVRLTAWRAAYLVATGQPSEQALLTAKFWAAEGGWRALHAALHVHGGVGVDRDYPLHRHFLRQKQLELHLGSATPSLVTLGRSLARIGRE